MVRLNFQKPFMKGPIIQFKEETLGMNQEYQDHFPQTKSIIFNTIQETRTDSKITGNPFFLFL